MIMVTNHQHSVSKDRLAPSSGCARCGDVQHKHQRPTRSTMGAPWRQKNDGISHGYTIKNRFFLGFHQQTW